MKYAIAKQAKTKTGWKRVKDTQFDSEESARRYGDKYHTDKSGAKMYKVIEHPNSVKEDAPNTKTRMTKEWTKLDNVNVWVKEDCGDEPKLAIVKIEDIEPEDTDYSYALIVPGGKALAFYRNLEDALEVDHIRYEDAPTNSVGSGNMASSSGAIAGFSPIMDILRRRKKLREITH